MSHQVQFERIHGKVVITCEAEFNILEGEAIDLSVSAHYVGDSGAVEDISGFLRAALPNIWQEIRDIAEIEAEGYIDSLA